VLSLLPYVLCARQQGMASIVEGAKTPVCSLKDTFVDCRQWGSCRRCSNPSARSAINLDKKRREPTSLPPFARTNAIGYLWPAWVMRAMMSRRLSRSTGCGGEEEEPFVVFVKDDVVVGAEELLFRGIESDDFHFRVVGFKPGDHFFSGLFGRGVTDDK
jgi:hypothetical protein